jgi:hypothetical protein
MKNCERCPDVRPQAAFTRSLASSPDISIDPPVASTGDTLAGTSGYDRSAGRVASTPLASK